MEPIRCHWEPLQELTASLFEAGGSPPEEAAAVAAHLVQSNLTGHDSHGVNRVRMYLDRVRAGQIVPGALPELLRERGAAALYTGNWGYGQVIAREVMARTIERARRHRLAAVTVARVNHIGRLAAYALQAAEAGMIGLVFTSNGGANRFVAPFGGRLGRGGTAPLAAAFPATGPWPVVMDMATSALANGKFRLWAQERQAVAPHLLQDAQGRPTTDAADLFAGGSILPLGAGQGYKGMLLNVLVEVLSGMLSGGGYSGLHKEQHDNCTMMIVLDVSAFRPLPAFQQALAGLVAYLKETPALPGEAVRFPGEMEARCETERRRDGIPLPAGTVAMLRQELARAGLRHRLLS